MQQNAAVLQQKLAERQKLLSPARPGQDAGADEQGDGPLTETVGQDVPTFNEVREKIEARYAKAKGEAELAETSVESRMLEVEQATVNVEAQSRLGQLRSRARPRRTGARRRRSTARRASRPQDGSRRLNVSATWCRHHEVVPVDDLVGDIRR